jgi:hypothetical protein
VYFAAEASTVVEVEMPEGATWDEIAEAASAKLDVGGLCHQCGRDYDLTDLDALLVDDEPAPGSQEPTAEDFRTALLDHLARAELQSLGLGPHDGAIVDLMAPSHARPGRQE